MKKILTISLLILPLILSGCNFAFGPGGGGTQRITNKGVYKTGNKGLEWVAQNTLEGSEIGLNNLNTHQLAFDIFDSNIIYRGSNGGLFISVNDGDSWQKISDKNINHFVLNPKTRGIIYIASGNQVFKTTDNGQDWQLIYTEAKPGVTIASLAISYFDTARIYLLTSDSDLRTSDDWGESWQTIKSFDTRPAKKIIINPSNSNIIFIATNNRLYRSTDQGQSWQELIQDKREDMPGLDQYRQLAFASQQNQLIYLSKYGLLKSSDNGSTWQKVRLITSPEAVDINQFSFNPSNTNELYYTIGNILYHSIDNGANWKTTTLPFPVGAKASQLLISPANENIIYLAVSQ